MTKVAHIWISVTATAVLSVVLLFLMRKLIEIGISFFYLQGKN